jgi:uncharacterized membrane protein
MALQYADETGFRCVEKTVTIRRPAIALYQAWRDLELVPLFMSPVLSVTEIGTRSRWVVKGGHGPVEWYAERTVDIPERLIVWRSLPNDAHVVGEVWFTRSRQGGATEVRVRIRCEPVDASFTDCFPTADGADPARLLDAALYRFRNLMETGTIPTTLQQPRGRRALAERARDRYEESALPAPSAWERFATGEVLP